MERETAVKQKGFTLLELMIVILVIGIVAAIAIPNLVKSKVVANEGAALSAVRNLVTAQYTYKTQISYVLFSPDLPTLVTAGLIDSVIGGGTKDGYTFSMTGSAEAFQVNSRPLVYDTTGIRSFYSDESGVVRYTTVNAPATSTSVPVGG